jgi:hypothetical protein
MDYGLDNDMLVGGSKLGLDLLKIMTRVILVAIVVELNPSLLSVERYWQCHFGIQIATKMLKY